MAFIKDVQNILKDYETQYEAIWAEYDKADDLYKQQRMTARVLEEERKKRCEQLGLLYRTAGEQINAALKKYVDALPARYAKNPEQMDANTLAMLSAASNGVLELTEGDIESLFAKAEGNLTLQGVLSDFVAKHDIPAKITFFSQAQRKADAENYAGGCIGALSRHNDMHMLPLSFGFYVDGKNVPAPLIGE